MQLVVVMAVKKAVSAATTTFTAISMNRFFMNLQCSMFNVQSSTFNLQRSIFSVYGSGSGSGFTMASIFSEAAFVQRKVESLFSSFLVKSPVACASSLALFTAY